MNIRDSQSVLSQQSHRNSLALSKSGANIMIAMKAAEEDEDFKKFLANQRSSSTMITYNSNKSVGDGKPHMQTFLDQPTQKQERSESLGRNDSLRIYTDSLQTPSIPDLKGSNYASSQTPQGAPNVPTIPYFSPTYQQNKEQRTIVSRN